MELGLQLRRSRLEVLSKARIRERKISRPAPPEFQKDKSLALYVVVGGIHK